MPVAPCPRCHTDVPEGSSYCNACGASLSKRRFPVLRLNPLVSPPTDVFVAATSLLLLISLFLPWYGYNSGDGVVSANGLSAHWFLYIPLVLSAGIVIAFLLERADIWRYPSETAALSKAQALFLATGTSFVCTLIGYIDKPGVGGIGWSWGALIGLITATAAFLPLLGGPQAAPRHRRR